MNHEPSVSAAPDADNTVLRQDDGNAARRTIQAKRKRNRELFNSKRSVFLIDLIRQIDLLIYAELAAIYYMEYAYQRCNRTSSCLQERTLTLPSCSFARLLIRAIVQFLFLSPKPSFLPEPPQNRPYLGAIFGSNLLCLLVHIIFDPPEAPESARGYLHGGLAMDFIGQKGPTSKIHLILLDLLVLGLQLVHLTAHITRLKVKKLASVSTATPATPATPAADAQPTQDLDFEERGLHRSDHEPVDIELQNLNPAGRQVESPSRDTTNDANNRRGASSEEQEPLLEEREALLSADTAPQTDAHIFDAFNSGEIMIADLNILHVVRSQFVEFQNAPRDTANTGTSLSERLAASGLGFRLRVGNRVLSV